MDTLRDRSCFLVEVTTTNPLNDRFVIRNYHEDGEAKYKDKGEVSYKCSDSLCYVIADSFSEVEKLFGVNVIISIKRVGVGYTKDQLQ